MTAYIGIRHRVKKTVEGELRPTQVCTIADKYGTVTNVELETEDDELAWAFDRFVTQWRKATPADKLEDFASWQKRTVGKGDKEYVQVAEEMEGLAAGDMVTMLLGGSGGDFTYALARRAALVGATIQVVPPFVLQQYRPAGRSKDLDALTLAQLGRDAPELCYRLENRDLGYIVVRETWFLLLDAMKSRMAAEARLRTRVIGERFRRPDGLYPEGNTEDAFAERKASDAIYQAMVQEEAKLLRELTRIVSMTPVWEHVFSSEKYRGVGPKIAARLIAATVDIRRFEVLADEQQMTALKAECNSIERCFIQELAQVPTGSCPFNRSGQINFWKVQKLASLKRSQNQMEDAQALERAVALHKQRAQLRKDAKRKGADKFVAFCGVHVEEDGRFVRRRKGAVANYHPEARQALWLLSDQWNRAPDSYWGKRLRENKANLQLKHPEPEEVNGKKRYTPGHIFKMARWRTITQFTRELFAEWIAAERRVASRHEVSQSHAA